MPTFQATWCEHHNMTATFEAKDAAEAERMILDGDISGTPTHDGAPIEDVDISLQIKP
jgi:hypothetical protein